MDSQTQTAVPKTSVTLRAFHTNDSLMPLSGRRPRDDRWPSSGGSVSAAHYESNSRTMRVMEVSRRRFSATGRCRSSSRQQP
jgi:hypothetical protein